MKRIMINRRNAARVCASLVLVLIACLACSCASSKRALRISPFSESEAVGGMGANRLNLWPLAYRDGKSTSVLWPVIDWDDRGFAVRPFYNREGRDQSVLFPLSAWNASKGQGWVTPVYWSDDNVGVPLVFNFGPNFNFVGPAWWNAGPDTLTARGLFPLASQRELDDPKRSDLRLGMGLLGSHRRWAEDNSRTWLAPFYYERRKPESLLRLALPLWLEHRTDKGGFTTVPPLFLYMHDETSAAFITPLGGYGKDRDGETTLRNIGGPLYHWHRTEDGVFTAWAWPLYQQHSTYNEFSATCWPLLTHLKRKSGSTRKLLVLGGAWCKTDNDSWALWGTQRGMRRGGVTSWHAWPFMSMLRHNPKRVKDPLFRLSLINAYSRGDEQGLMMTPLFGYTKQDDLSELRAWPFYRREKLSTPPTVTHNFLVLGRLRTTESETRTRFWPLFATVASQRQAELGLLDRWSLFASLNGRDNWERRIGLGLIYNSSGRTDGDTSRTHRSFLTLTGGHSWKRPPRTTIEAWSRSYGLTPAGNVTRKGWYVFPLVFASKSTTLELFAHQQEDLDVIQEWMTLDARRNADPDDLRQAEERMLKVIGNHPEAAALLEEMASLEGPDRSRCLRNAIAAFAKDHATQTVQKRFGIPLVFNRSKTGERQRWSLLLGLANYRKNGPDESRLSILRYLYRREVADQHVYRDIFPFITWNTTDSGSRFSFFWRLVNLERQGEHKSGHILFIPFGK